VHCDHRGLNAPERLRVTRISALSVMTRYNHEYKKRCYTAVRFVHGM